MPEWEEIAALVGLFGAAFGAATILPFQSEIVYVGLILAGDFSYPLLLVVASVGNTLGSMLNWVMGRFIEHFRNRKWFPANEQQLDRAQNWYLRYGLWTLLISWAPFGDVVTIIAGVMRTPLWIFTVIVFAVKFGRYLAVGWAVGA